MKFLYNRLSVTKLTQLGLPVVEFGNVAEWGGIKFINYSLFI